MKDIINDLAMCMIKRFVWLVGILFAIGIAAAILHGCMGPSPDQGAEFQEQRDTLYTLEEIEQEIDHGNLQVLPLRTVPGNSWTQVTSADTIDAIGFALMSQDSSNSRQLIITDEAMRSWVASVSQDSAAGGVTDPLVIGNTTIGGAANTIDWVGTATLEPTGSMLINATTAVGTNTDNYVLLSSTSTAAMIRNNAVSNSRINFLTGGGVYIQATDPGDNITLVVGTGDINLSGDVHLTEGIALGSGDTVLVRDSTTGQIQGRLASSIGDVTKTGTPSNNMVAIWTADGIIEGDGNLTFDGTNLDVSGAAIIGGETQIGGGADTGPEKLQVTGDAIIAGGLEVSSTTGALILPRMTTTQRDAMGTANGSVIYNTTTAKLQVRAAGAWVDLH